MSTPIVDLTPLSQPVTKLVEVVAQGIGTLYKPIGTIAQAKADAKVKLILAEADIATSQLWQRAADRLAHTEIERQTNLEAIVEKAYLALPAQASDRPVAKDWTTHFFTAAQDISDQDLQLIWGKILAGEVAEPGNTSRRTLEFLKTMSKQEADFFISLLSVSFIADDGWRFIVEDEVTSKTIYEMHEGADIERHMIDIGILGSEPVIISASQANAWRFSYGTKKYRFVGPKPPSPDPVSGIKLLEYQLGVRLYSSIGQQLSNVAQQKEVQGFITRLSSSIHGQIEVRIEEDNKEQASEPK